MSAVASTGLASAPSYSPMSTVQPPFELARVPVTPDNPNRIILPHYVPAFGVGGPVPGLNAAFYVLGNPNNVLTAGIDSFSLFGSFPLAGRALDMAAWTPIVANLLTQLGGPPLASGADAIAGALFSQYQRLQRLLSTPQFKGLNIRVIPTLVAIAPLREAAEVAPRGHKALDRTEVGLGVTVVLPGTNSAGSRFGSGMAFFVNARQNLGELLSGKDPQRVVGFGAVAQNVPVPKTSHKVKVNVGLAWGARLVPGSSGAPWELELPGHGEKHVLPDPLAAVLNALTGRKASLTGAGFEGITALVEKYIPGSENLQGLGPPALAVLDGLGAAGLGATIGKVLGGPLGAVVGGVGGLGWWGWNQLWRQSQSETGTETDGSGRPAVEEKGPANPSGVRQFVETIEEGLPVMATLSEVKVEPGFWNWDEVGERARAFNEQASQSGSPEVMIRVPVNRNDGRFAGRQVALVTGMPFRVLDQLRAMQESGIVPPGFDVRGAATQVGVNLAEMLQREANLRAPQIAQQHPMPRHGNQTSPQRSWPVAVATAQEFNRTNANPGQVAIPVSIYREISSGSTQATGVSHEVWVGSPDQFADWHQHFGALGRLPGNRAIGWYVEQAGLQGSWQQRTQWALDRRAFHAERSSPTGFRGATVGVAPTERDAIATVLAFNQQANGEVLQLYVPLRHQISAPGVGGWGVAHTIFEGSAREIQDFFEHMNRGGRLPPTATLDALLLKSGIQRRVRQRLGAMEGR